MTTPVPLEKKFGGGIGINDGIRLLHESITNRGSKRIAASVAEDMNTVFSQVQMQLAKPIDEIYAARLSGYLAEMVRVFELMVEMLDALGFEFETYSRNDRRFAVKIVQKRGSK